jgi:hypothetical protein
MDNITDIQDAKAFKRMGVPLNTPVTETRTFSHAYSKQWFSLGKAHDDFCGALADYIEAQSVPVWRKLCKSLNGIAREVKRAEVRLGKFEDSIEQALMVAFLQQRAIPFFEYWAQALEAVDDGATLEITPADWPIWTDED